MADPLCADCTAPPTWRDCPTCSDPNHPHPGQCGRCLINSRLDELMGPDTDCLPPGLRTLRENISTAEHHITAMRWLTKPAIAPVLADLAAGRLPLTHQAFDELGDTQALAHLRQTLVAVGALPERDEDEDVAAVLREHRVPVDERPDRLHGIQGNPLGPADDRRPGS